MRMYSSQSTCIEVDWSGIKLSSIPPLQHICRLKSIHIYCSRIELNTHVLRWIRALIHVDIDINLTTSNKTLDNF
jgi:hypothetical protein